MTLPPPVPAAEVHRLLLDRGVTVAVAESLTGGLLGGALTSTPGSSSTFRGGLIVYATDLKETLAGVPRPLLEAEGAVSASVAAALAAGARDQARATYGVGVTGVAGPDPQDGQPVGMVFVAVAGPEEGIVRSLRCEGDREQIRAQTVAAALSILAEVVTGDG